MSVTSRVTVALLAGLVFGILADRSDSPALATAVTALEPIGTLWVNAFRMTVVPLVVALLVRGIAGSAQPAGLGRLGVATAGLAIGSLVVVATVTALLVPVIFRWLPVDPTGAAALRAGTPAAPAGAGSSPVEWLVSLVPVNPVRAAADGAMLPLLVFVIAFACALRHVPPEPRRALVLVFDGVAEAMLQIVRWVLALAPLGVLALASALGAKFGVSAAGALGYFVLLTCAMQVAVGLTLYPIAAAAGRVPMRLFAASAAPAQAVAFGARSSLAALPAMMEGARRLGVPSHVAAFVLPLAASTYRITAASYWVVSAAMVARLYGVEFGPAQIAVVALASATYSLATPGVPMGGLLIQAPLYAAVGLPVEGLAILMAVDAVPDMFKTALNVTADMTLVTVLGRSRRGLVGAASSPAADATPAGAVPAGGVPAARAPAPTS